MARTEYTINAYSKTANQSVREINLQMGNPQITDQRYAQQIADAFAYRMNQKKHLQTNDWVGQVKLETVGIETIPNYLFHEGR